MPLHEPVVLEQRKYTFRHVGPRAAVWSGSPAANLTFLGRTDYVARPLPTADLPSSPDFASGEFNLRLMDAGDFQLTFPNKEASDGVPWRNRFDPTAHLQWIEQWVDNYLEAVYCITKNDNERDHVEIEGFDGMFLLKKGFQRDWVVTQAPRDVIERGTKLWVPLVTDNFAYIGSSSPAGIWGISNVGGATTTITNPGGGLVMASTGATQSASIQSSAIPVTSTGIWSVQIDTSSISLGGSNTTFTVNVGESNGDQYDLIFGLGQVASLSGSFLTNRSTVRVPMAPSYSFLMESDGIFVTAFVNGQLIGGIRRNQGLATTLSVNVVINSGTGTTITATLSGALLEALQPYLMAGTSGANADKGDYVLPGNIDTYTPGGLHARYYNDLDLASDTYRLYRIQHPTRTQIYNSTNAAEYTNQQDSTINGQANPLPGAAQSNWSAQWFGAIYLAASSGNYTFSITWPAHANNQVVKVQIGKTDGANAIIDTWTGNSTFVNTSSGTVNSVGQAIGSGGNYDLKGTLSYGGGKVWRDGWYPIVISYAVDSTNSTAPIFKFNSYSGSTYTDPGGFSINPASMPFVVPASSLSTLGCVDDRFQGTSHFDLVTKTAISVGYQISLEPYQFETLGQAGVGRFPGVVAPRIREGTDYDTVLEPDQRPRQPTDPLMDYGNVLDATDCALSILGNGAGFQNGNVGQLQGRAYDPPLLTNALFDIQGWQDASDISYSPLLGLFLQAQLGLRLLPWQAIAASPHGRPRIANTWPLTGTTASMRWRPGDGLKVYSREINVQDTVPRQLWLVNRQILPHGNQSTSLGLAGLPNANTGSFSFNQKVVRPRSTPDAMTKAVRTLQRLGRCYQRQLVSLSGEHRIKVPILAGTNGIQSSQVALWPGDLIVAVAVRVNYNSKNVSFGVILNGVDVTTTLNGPWTHVPLNMNLGAVATPDSNDLLAVQIHNRDVSSRSLFSWQLLVDVLR